MPFSKNKGRTREVRNSLSAALFALLKEKLTSSIKIEMVNDERIRFFQQQILQWFQKHGRQFPWRKDNATPYELVITEILLQRTKAETVSSFYSKFLTEFPTWEYLADADLEVVQKHLMPIGLYRQRALRLKKLAVYMVEHHNLLPLSRNDLENVPFMGQYIANAVELLIHKRNKPLLDVNMSRVLERYFGPRKLRDIRYDPYLQDLAHRVTNHKQSKFLNWGILDFAALICKARNPSCLICILNTRCRYYSKYVTN